MKAPVPVSFLIKLHAEARNVIKKETLVEVFSCEFCEISKNIFFPEHLRATASVMKIMMLVMEKKECC